MVLAWVLSHQPAGSPAGVTLAESYPSQQHTAVLKTDDSCLVLSLPSSLPIPLPKAALKPKIALLKITTVCAGMGVLLWVR